MQSRTCRTSTINTEENDDRLSACHRMSVWMYEGTQQERNTRARVCTRVWKKVTIYVLQYIAHAHLIARINRTEERRVYNNIKQKLAISLSIHAYI